jgi:3-phenylpropionate/trans-cinnamate dioxygenase ferredoxin reductase component
VSGLRRVVIVGNGIAGVTAADSLRDAGYDGELTLVGDEEHAAYSRPALSKALLRDEPTAHVLPPTSHGAVELLGIAAVGLDVERRRVLLDGGQSLPYDGLVVASGCRARRLGGTGEHDDVLSLRSLDDAWRLRARMADRPSVVVVGDGPLGMEIASSCLAGGCEVTLVSQGRPLALQLGDFLSDVVVSAARARGLRIVTTAEASLERSDGRSHVVLAEGGRLEAGLVVTAVGDEPNVEWLAGTGLLCDGRLQVDSRGRVTPEVVAAGDVAAVPTPFGVRRVPLWSSAIEQGRVAATALVHGDAVEPLESRPYFWTEQFGLVLKAVGHLPLAGAPEVVDGDLADLAAVLRWGGPHPAAVALNVRMAIPRLRRLCEPAVPA